MLALQREAAWAKERLLGDLRQSVPQNGRVHLHSIDALPGAAATLRTVRLANASRRGGGGCTRAKWVPFVLLAFFPCFIVFFASKLAIYPLKRSVWELEKATFGPEKAKW